MKEKKPSELALKEERPMEPKVGMIINILSKRTDL
jgi:hypothetical protein